MQPTTRPPNPKLEYQNNMVEHMRPSAQAALEGIRVTLKRSRPEFLLDDAGMAFERLRWVDAIIQKVRVRVLPDTDFLKSFAVTLDQAFGLQTALEESDSNPLENLIAFATGVTNLLSQTARELLSSANYEQFVTLLDGEIEPLAEFISSFAPTIAGSLLAWSFVLDVASNANSVDNGEACKVFEDNLNTTLRAVISGQFVQA